MNSDFDIQQYLIDLSSKAMRNIEDACIRDCDGSKYNRWKTEAILATIRRCERRLEVLLSQTEEIGGFCSSYPREALKNMKIMKKILRMENDQ